jgi:hypothetical protein
MKRVLILAFFAVACNSEREPPKQGPGEGFDWPGTPAATPAAPQSTAPARAAPAPVARALEDYEKKLVFADSFDRPALGPDWQFQGGTWLIQEGAVHSPKALNKCLWLTRPIPADVVLEMEAWSMSPRGDIKITVFGDGVEHETGYTMVLGGWFNSISIIARMDEHGADRKERQDKGVVVPGKRFKFELRRLGNRIDWLVDGRPYLSFDDPSPLRGPGHDRFAFCNWECPLYFDNFKVWALTEKAQAPKAAPPSPMKVPQLSPRPRAEPPVEASGGAPALGQPQLSPQPAPAPAPVPIKLPLPLKKKTP